MKVTNLTQSRLYLHDLKGSRESQVEGRRGEDRYLAPGESLDLPNTSEVLRSAHSGDLKKWREKGWVSLEDFAEWLNIRGGIQTAPFLGIGAKIIHQAYAVSGTAAEDAGADTIDLHGGDLGRTFKLFGRLGAVTGTVYFEWYSVTDSVSVSPYGVYLSSAWMQDAVGYVNVPAGQTQRVCLRIRYASGLTQIGTTGPGGDLFPLMLVEAL